jgi:transcriptional regulator with XRE-family HTH domain
MALLSVSAVCFTAWQVVSDQLTPLGRLLAAREITGRELAVAIGTPESTVSRWRGRVTPPSEKFRKAIIRRLKLTDEELRDLGWPEGEKESAGV